MMFKVFTNGNCSTNQILITSKCVLRFLSLAVVLFFKKFLSPISILILHNLYIAYDLLLGHKLMVINVCIKILKNV